ncbi:hypothetical protein J4855_04475 [Prevotella denticola]|nr:hypothetical protein [Prevotella denticola]QUB91711.1 hypothetical protein J4855_04475 [Prevotella denticola]
MQPSIFRVYFHCPLPGNLAPFCRNDNEEKDKAIQPTFHVNAREDAADSSQQIPVKILQHGGKEQEYRIVFHRRERKVRPPEVVVLHIEILLARSSLVVPVNDLLISAVMVAGQYGTVHILHTRQESLSPAPYSSLYATRQGAGGQKGNPQTQMRQRPFPVR